MKSAQDPQQSRQLQRLLYVVFPTRERQIRTARQMKSAPAYLWGKRDLRSMRTRPGG